jgi:hypothetical protein
VTSKAIPVALIVIGTVTWMFLGVERSNREHGETDYEFFAKQSPTARIVFENPAKCGECDLRAWDLMGPESRGRFAEYCNVRFGLEDVDACYAIFETRQRAARTRLGLPEYSK